MRKLRLISVLCFALILFFYSCGETKKKPELDSTPAQISVSDSNWRRVSSHEMSLEIPLFMKEDPSLDPAAIIQYAAYDSELYVVVYSQRKEDFMNEGLKQRAYDLNRSVTTNLMLSKLKILYSNAHVNSEIEMDTMGLIKYCSLDASVEGVNYPLRYEYAFAEGKGNVYTMMCWTLKQNELMNRKYMNRIIHSFREE
jgi:hypothetical protein